MIENQVNILIVDDHPENLITMEAVLASLNQNIIKANSGKEALLQVLSHNFAVILMDVVMPDMDGFETAKLIRDREKSGKIPIIFVTANNIDEINIKKGYSIGGIDYIIKPFSPDILLMKVSAFVDLEKNRLLIQNNNEIIKDQLQQLKKTTDALRISNNDLEQFAYIISHDLQDPLRMITNFLELLNLKYKDKIDKEAEEYISFSMNGAKNLQILITELLHYSRINASNIYFEEVNCESIIINAITNLRENIKKTNAIIKYEELPTIWGDKALLTQLFQNLIHNGIKFCDNKIPKIEIFVENNEKEWIFSVKDNGIGIDPNNIDKLFKKFYKFSSNRKYPGTGWGLIICKKIIDIHNGQIWVESEEGNGSNFYFKIPKK